MRRAFIVAVLLAASFHALYAQQAGLNTPVLPPLPADPNDPNGVVKSDLLQQRQVEPDILVSTRNPQHLLAVFNDYRTVDVAADAYDADEFASSGLKGFFGRAFALLSGHRRPALPLHAAASSQPTIGIARSNDGGLTWSGALLPGSLPDTSPASLASPVYGMQTMTDPRAAAAPCGIAYVAFIAFTSGDKSMVAVARYQDDNLPDTGRVWRYQGTSVLQVGNNSASGVFHDLPAIIVDPVRTATTDRCAHNIYVGWARFNGNNVASTLNFATATSGSGSTWNPSWKSFYVSTPDKSNQGVALAVDPRTGTPKTTGGGTLYYAWRAFASNQNPDRFWIARSTDYGQSVVDVQLVTGTSAVYPYDQPNVTSTQTTVPDYLAFRSNAMPTLAVVPNPPPAGAASPVNPSGSTVFVAWQERVSMSCPGTTCGLPYQYGDPKVVITRTADYKTWSPRYGVDVGDRDVTPPPPGYGYLPQPRPSGGQIMPKLSFGGGRLALLYLEGRGPLTAVPSTLGLISGYHRQFDARLALLDPTDGHLLGTSQVSRYSLKYAADLSNGEDLSDIVETAPGEPQVNMRNGAPNSGGGTTPFMGDYIGLTPVTRLIFDAALQTWRWAINPSDVPFQGFRAVFADSRNQVPPSPGADPTIQIPQYPNYSPPGTSQPPCINPGSRNHDTMHALVNATFTVNAAVTFKQANIDRGFPITLTNGTAMSQFYQLTFSNPALGSWNQNDPNQDPQYDVVNVQLFPYSATTRTAYVSASSSTAAVQVIVNALQYSGCTVDTASLTNPACTFTVGPVVGAATLNLDPTNPQYTTADGSTTETYNPLVSNPLVSNPLVSNPLVSNPLVSNPLVSNPLVSNPLVSNPLVSNSTVYDITDTTWTVNNSGDSTSGYLSQLNLGDLDTLSGNYAFQLMIYKKSLSAGLNGCNTVAVPFDQLIASIPNPTISTSTISTNPIYADPLNRDARVSNATFAEAPPAATQSDGTTQDSRPDVVYVTLRAYQLKPSAQLTAKFDPKDNPPAFAVHAHAANTNNGTKEQKPRFDAKGSDLSATGTIPPATVIAGYTTSIPQLTVLNTGNLKSGPYRYGYYLSTDPVLDPKADTLLLAGANQPNLQPASTTSVGPASVTIPANTPPGSYYYGIVVDDTGHVGETDETNNYLSAPITVLSTGTIDQQQPLIDSTAGTLGIGGPNTQKAAQIITAGLSMSLTDVLLPLTCTPDATVVLQIQGVTTKGLPNGITALTTSFAGGSTSTDGSGFYDYRLSSSLAIVAGKQYAIVLSGATTAGSCAIALGPTSNPYSGGGAFSDSATVTPGVWDPLANRRDLPFKTIVR